MNVRQSFIVQALFFLTFGGMLLANPRQALAQCEDADDCAPGFECDVANNRCVEFGECDPGAGGVDLGSCLKLSDDSTVRYRYNNPAFLVNLVVQNLFVLSGVILFVMIIVAGIKFIAGGKKGMEEARTIIGTALAGFIIMFSAYWIVQLIKYLTGADILL